MRIPTLALVIVPAVALILLGCGRPGEAQRHYDAGVELQDRGELSEAITAYTEAIAADPGMVEAYKRRAKAYLELGQNQRAAHDYETAADLAPDDTATANQAKASLDLGQPERALKDLE